MCYGYCNSITQHTARIIYPNNITWDIQSNTFMYYPFTAVICDLDCKIQPCEHKKSSNFYTCSIIT